MKKSFVFYLMLFVTILMFALFLNKVFINTGIKIKNNIYPPVYDVMDVILETKLDDKNDILLEADNVLYHFENEEKTIKKMLQGKVDEINILVKKDFKNKTDGVIVFKEIKANYYKDFSKFEKSETKACINNACGEYHKFKLPYKGNFHSVQNLISNVILFVIQGKMIPLIPLPFILMFITLIYYIHNQDSIKLFRINPYIISLIIFIFGVILYSNGIFSYSLWGDEFYSVMVAQPATPFSDMFQDPGNPPLFYILLKAAFYICSNIYFAVKLFLLIVSILFILILWAFLKKRYGISTANLGIALAFICPPLIYYSIEARSYILQVLFTPLLIWVLFNIFEKNRKKDYVIYGILTAIVSNIHYYELLLLFSNFVFATAYFIYKKRYKDIFKFFLSNLAGVAFFLPFFIFTAFNKALLNPSFNAWIPETNYSQIKKCAFYLFSGGLSLLFYVFFFIRALIKRNLMCSYLFFAAFFTFFSAIMFSIIVRPIFVERYLVLLFPLLIIFLALTFREKYKNKFIIVFFLIWILIIQGESLKKKVARQGFIDTAIYLSSEYQREHKNDNVYVATPTEIFTLLNVKDKSATNNLNIIVSSLSGIEEATKQILKNNKDAIVFTQFFIEDENLIKTPYKNSSTRILFYKIQNKK